MSAESPRRGSRSVPAMVPPQVVIDRSILESAFGFISDVTQTHQPHTDPKDTITWARFESAADISDPCFGDDWELEGNDAPPLLLILGYGLGVQMWAIPANGEAVEVLSWRHGSVTALRVLPTPASSSAIEENGRADEPVDAFADKRPLIALVDGSSSTGAPPQFCAVNFVSLKTGAQVKTIKFKNPVIDILANRSSIVITFNERIAVFDARTLEDRLSVTTCFPSPGINPNPVALGPRWLAYAEHRLLPSKRSGGGCDGETASSYAATMLNAAKSIGKGIFGFGEQVAMGLTGASTSGSASKSNSFDSNSGDIRQPGIITIMDIKHAIRDYSPTSGTPMSAQAGSDSIVAHFVAHSDAIVALDFDNSGMLLLTADRRGNYFNVFRIQPHPVGSSLASVQHLYVLHRGDTSAKVQNIAFTLDSRWVAVSTLRGTTHVFPITSYGGPMGGRTHTSLHVVNKVSRYHRSAGLEGRSSSPVSHSECALYQQSLTTYQNATVPPFPRPVIVQPLAQLRQPFVLGSPPGPAPMLGAGHKMSGGAGSSGILQRQRLTSLSDDNGKPLSVCAIFAKSRSWLLDPPMTSREAPHRQQRKAVDSLFVMAGHGALIQYDLDTKLSSNVAKDKICDQTPIELEVAAKAQWNLGRRRDGSQEIVPPLTLDNWLIRDRSSLTDNTRQFDETEDQTESWLPQVEIITHAGPHRRLWMGPQFVFKTYNTPSGSNLNHIDVEAVEIGISPNPTSATATTTRIVERSSPLNMPPSAAGRSAAVPVLIESGSYSSIELSPKLNAIRSRHDNLDADFGGAHGELRIKEDLADAMRESPPSSAQKDTGRRTLSDAASDKVPFYDARAELDDDEQSSRSFSSSSSAAASLANALPNIYSFARVPADVPCVENYVNTFGTVTTVLSGTSVPVHSHDILDEVVSQLALEDIVIHENTDESLFRPVVALFCNEEEFKRGEEEARKLRELCKPPEVIENKLIVPVIEKEVNAEICKKEKQKNDAKRRDQECDKDVQKQFAEFSTINKRSKGSSSSTSSSCSKESVDIKVEIKNTSVLKKVETKKIKTSVEPESVESNKGGKMQIETKSIKINQLKDEAKPTTTKKVIENIGKSEVPVEKSRKVSVEKCEAEVKPEVSRETERKEPSKKSKRNSVERELNKSSSEKRVEEKKEISEGKTLVTTLHAEVLSQQTAADNAKSQSAKQKTVKPEVSRETERKEPSKKSKRNSEERELTKSSSENRVEEKKEMPEDKTLVTPLHAEVLSQQTAADNAKSQSAKEKTAAATEINTISKTAIIQKTTEMKPTTLKSDIKGQVSTKEASTKSNKVKTDLEAKESKETKIGSEAVLAESIIEIKVDTDSVIRKEKSTVIVEDKSLDPFEIFQVPLVASKKIKQYKSGTSPDPDELIEVLALRNAKLKTKYIEENNKLPDKLLKKKSVTSENSLSMDIHHKFNRKDDERFISENTAEENENLAANVEPNWTAKNISKKPVKLEDEIKVVEDKEISTKSQKTKVDGVKPKDPELKEKNSNDFKEKAAITSTNKKATKALKETDSLKTTGNIDTTKIEEGLMKKSSLEVLKVAKGLIPGDHKEQQPHQQDLKTPRDEAPFLEKPKESKGAIKKEYGKPKVSSRATDLGDNVKLVDTAKREIIVESVINTDLTSRETKTCKEYKSDIKQEIVALKSLKNNLADVNKADAEISPKTMDTLLEMEKLKLRKLENDSKLEEVLVITEQPTKTIKSTNACQPLLIKKMAPPVPVTKVEDSAAVLCASDKKDKAKKLAKVIPSKCRAAEDELDGVIATSSKSNREKTLTAVKMPKDLEIKVDDYKLKHTTAPVPPAASVWQTLSGAELLKNVDTSKISGDIAEQQYPSLVKVTDIKKATKPTELETKPAKLLPDIPTPLKLSPDFKEPIAVAKTKSKSKKLLSAGFDDFPLLKPLESLSPLPPLPDLEPLELPFHAIGKLTESDALTQRDQISLINFESPEKQEQPELERPMTPSPRGFSEQSLVYALCGSLHYENESSTASNAIVRDLTPEKCDLSPTLSSTRSTTDYKSLTENDEPYMSLEQSSQETNTTNTNTTTTTTNEKLSSSSPNSSSEEIVHLEEKKVTKKQKRKKQQMDLQKQKEQQLNDSANEVDEELRPLICMSASFATSRHHFDELSSAQPTFHLVESRSLPKAAAFPFASTSCRQFAHYTTTDSEGPMPGTTSDDNVYGGLATSSMPQKLKTKKLEHKINLMAAIEAATSSSTSSAEESGQEAGDGNGRASAASSPPLITIAGSVGQHDRHQMPPIMGTTAAMQSALKKKTKRRKR